MSYDKKYLSLRLEGPLQSWGYDSQYTRRNTGLMPTKSGIAGMCCAALGFSRGCEEEKQFLLEFSKVRMTSVAVPRKAGKKELHVRRMNDFHTVQQTRRANGSINHDCVLTQRQYLLDSYFGVVLEGESNLLGKIADALLDPVWGVWLGRKTCIPSAPVFAGLTNERADALRLLIGEQPVESFTTQEEVENFSDGMDSLPDSPASFDSYNRVFHPRRIKTVQKSSIRGTL